MKPFKITLLALIVAIGSTVTGQKIQTIPDLSKVKDPEQWVSFNRDITIENNGSIHLDGKPGDGLLLLRNLDFTNGKIDCDIKGQDIQGRSFVGLAFHGLNDSTFDAVYFRPFNFQNEERSGHSVQYISHPTYTWYKLREEHPGKYENNLNPVPHPEDWFHVSIIIGYPDVEVYVDDSDVPSLKVTQLSSHKHGWIGFWVGNNSEGSFKNLKITPE
ncbi:MAG: family 16 glycoside hydrolase [Bacteroidales bacterium]